MITVDDKLAMDYRDAGLYTQDFPIKCENRQCSKCGLTISEDSVISFLTENSHGIDHFEYHKQCVKKALEYGNFNFQQSSPIKVPFRD